MFLAFLIVYRFY